MSATKTTARTPARARKTATTKKAVPKATRRVARDLSKVETERASQINREHEASEAAWGNAVEHACRAGQLLIEAKAQLKHGEWMPWVEANCAFSQSTANAYMQVARWERQNSQLPANLTLDGALKHISAPKSDDEEFLAECDRLAAQIERAQKAEERLSELLRERDDATFERVVKRSRLPVRKLKALRSHRGVA